MIFQAPENDFVMCCEEKQWVCEAQVGPRQQWQVSAVNPLWRQCRAKLDWLVGQAPLPGRWDPIIRQTRTPPPGFHSSTVYHMALSSWAPLTDNERRQPAQLQAKHSTFYRPKHVSGKLTVSIQFCSAFKRPITIPFPWATPFYSYSSFDPCRTKTGYSVPLFEFRGNEI